MCRSDFNRLWESQGTWSKAWWILALLLMVTLLCLGNSQSKRTKWRGKSVEAWLVAIQSLNQRERLEAEEAMRGLGTNAIPTLVTYLKYNDSETKKRFFQWMAGHQWFWRLQLPLGASISENYYHSKAACAFRALGTNGQAALPSLRLLFNDPSSSGEYAAASVVWVAPAEARELADQFMQSTNRLFYHRGSRMKALMAAQQAANGHLRSRRE